MKKVADYGRFLEAGVRQLKRGAEPVARPIDFVTARRLRALDVKLDIALKQASETLQEIRAAVRR